MESIENKTIYLVETVLKQCNISIDVPRYIYGIEEAKNFFLYLIGNKSVENFYAIYMDMAYEVVAISFIAKGDAANVSGDIVADLAESGWIRISDGVSVHPLIAEVVLATIFEKQYLHPPQDTESDTQIPVTGFLMNGVIIWTLLMLWNGNVHPYMSIYSLNSIPASSSVISSLKWCSVLQSGSASIE